MKCLILILSLLQLIFNSSCTFTTQKKVAFEKEENINLNSLGDSSIIGLPLEMIIYNKYLFINDFRGDSLLWMYDISQKKMIQKYLSKGNGPNEYISPLQIFNDDSVFIIQNRITYSYDECLFDSEKLDFVYLNPRKSISTDVDKIFLLNNKKYIASGRFIEGRYALLDSAGVIVHYFGEYPNFNSEEKGIPNFPKFMFHQTSFSYNKYQRLLASITGHVLEILDCSTDVPSRKSQILLSPYSYSYEEGDGWANAWGKEDMEIGVMSICSTRNYIYMLYNPNTIVEMKDNIPPTIEIWIFDWDGLPIKKLILNKLVTCICVEKDDSIIYCTVNEPDPTLAFFKLDTVL